MSQPASLHEPRGGETVLACKHAYLGRLWRMKAYFVGHRDEEGNATGLGKLVTGGRGHQLYIRWAVLCWVCRIWHRLSRKQPLQLALYQSEWVAEEPADHWQGSTGPGGGEA